MKTMHFLMILFLGCFLFSCGSDSTSLKTLQAENDSLKLKLQKLELKPFNYADGDIALEGKTNKDILKGLCLELEDRIAKSNSESLGDSFIDAGEAARKIRNGINTRRSIHTQQYIYKESDDILAFYFPLEEVEELLKRIAKHPSAKEIAGIRVYMAARSATIPDAFMIPVKMDMTDIVKVYYQEGEDIPDISTKNIDPVLNNSVPCPTVCP